MAWREVALVAKSMRQRPTHLPIRGHAVRARPVLSLSDAVQPSAYLTACLYERLNGLKEDEHGIAAPVPVSGSLASVRFSQPVSRVVLAIHAHLGVVVSS